MLLQGRKLNSLVFELHTCIPSYEILLYFFRCYLLSGMSSSMPVNDHESFHLLQISDSASDSLPDLDLVTLNHNTQHKKKKVRLKR